MFFTLDNERVERLEERLADMTRVKKENEVYFNNERKSLEVKHQMELEVKDHLHEMTIKQHTFDLKHYKDETIKKLELESSLLRQKNAVLENENKMLDKMVQIDADVIDVKDLVKNLINKLPEVNLQNLTLNAPQQK